MNTDDPHLDDKTMQAFLEGVPEGDRLTDIRRHLAACEECNQRVQALRRIELALQNLPREHADPSLTDRILEQTGIATQKIYRLAGVMAGMMAAVFVGGTLLALFGVLGILPIQASAGSLSFFDAPWKSTSGFIDASVDSLRQLIGTGTISVSSMVTTALSVGVILVLLGLDRALGRWWVRGDTAR